MFKRRRTRFHPNIASKIARLQRIELVIDITNVGLVAGMFGPAPQSTIQAMLAHPSAAHLLTVVLISIAGTLVCKAWGEQDRRIAFKIPFRTRAE